MSIQQLDVQALIDQLGPPPPEVAQDWAYQLLETCRGEALPDLEWSQVIVGEDGRLLLNHAERTGATTDTAVALSNIKQLLLWSGIPGDKVAPLTSCQECLQHFEQALGRGAEVRIDEPPDDEGYNSAYQLSESASTSADGPDDRPFSIQNAPPTSKDRLGSRAAGGNRWRVIAAAIALMAFLSVGWLGYWLTSSPAPHDSVAVKQPSDGNSIVHSAGIDETEEAALPASPDHPGSESIELKTLTEEPSVRPESELGIPDTATNGVASLQSIVGTLSMEATAPIPKAVASSPEADAEIASSPEVAAADMSDKDAVSGEDVATLLSQGLEMEPAVTKPASPDGAGRDTPPILLDVETPFQVTEVAAKVRLRQPQWQLRISATEEFSVTPSEPQSLSEKETLRWQLQPTASKPRQDQQPTTVVVFAQLDSRNKRDLKWKIVAGSPDLPNIALPLNEAKLDQLLTLLQAYQQRLGQNLETLKVAADLTGLPREQRSAISAQRRFIDSETKMVARARQLIADAGMYVGLLDRTLEVHAKLVDQVGGQETVVLQFGQPTLSADPAAAAESKVDAAHNSTQLDQPQSSAIPQ